VVVGFKYPRAPWFFLVASSDQTESGGVVKLRFLLLLLLVFSSTALAHEISFSHLRLEINPTQSQVRLEVPVVDLARQLSITGTQLLESKSLNQFKPQILELIQQRFSINNQKLMVTGFHLELLPAKKEIRVTWTMPGLQTNTAFQIKVLLFPDNPLHKTFLDIYKNQMLEQQVIFDVQTTEFSYSSAHTQGVVTVIWGFILEGIHHIFIGPDHILFIVGLLLLGGNLWQLLKIVSLFTLAHSVTLALATLHILNPPASLIEPTIAASIVFVGLHSLRGSKHDLRQVFAFVFGFIHGFGFANALSEMALPQNALIASLFAFNFGVEIGQLCIVLLVAPLLMLLRKYYPKNAVPVIRVASFAVIAAGAYWFVERVAGA
jgi:hydrogenase/urease accessory protein HupE